LAARAFAGATIAATRPSTVFPFNVAIWASDRPLRRAALRSFGVIPRYFAAAPRRFTTTMRPTSALVPLGEPPAGEDAEALGVGDPLLQLRALFGCQPAGSDRGVDPGVQLRLEGGTKLVARDAEARSDGVAE
jgi:hypothetical protein